MLSAIELLPTTTKQAQYLRLKATMRRRKIEFDAATSDLADAEENLAWWEARRVYSESAALEKLQMIQLCKRAVRSAVRREDEAKTSFRAARRAVKRHRELHRDELVLPTVKVPDAEAYAEVTEYRRSVATECAERTDVVTSRNSKPYSVRRGPNRRQKRAYGRFRARRQKRTFAFNEALFDTSAL